MKESNKNYNTKARFTKTKFVWDKNPQKLEAGLLIYFFRWSQIWIHIFDVSNYLQMAANFRFLQEFTYYNFSLPLKCHNFHHKSHNFVSATFFVFIVLLTSRCGAKITQNKKLKYKMNRWMNFKMDTIFMLRMKSWIK